MCAKAGIITFVSAVLIKGASNNERRGTIPICFFVMVKLSRKRSSSDNDMMPGSKQAFYV